MALACEVARTILGREAAATTEVLRDVTARALARVRRARTVVLRVHPDDAEAARGAVGGGSRRGCGPRRWRWWATMRWGAAVRWSRPSSAAWTLAWSASSKKSPASSKAARGSCRRSARAAVQPPLEPSAPPFDEEIRPSDTGAVFALEPIRWRLPLGLFLATLASTFYVGGGPGAAAHAVGVLRAAAGGGVARRRARLRVGPRAGLVLRAPAPRHPALPRVRALPHGAAPPGAIEPAAVHPRAQPLRHDGRGHLDEGPHQDARRARRHRRRGSPRRPRRGAPGDRARPRPLARRARRGQGGLRDGGRLAALPRCSSGRCAGPSPRATTCGSTPSPSPAGRASSSP